MFGKQCGDSKEVAKETREVGKGWVTEDLWGLTLDGR